MKVILFEEDRIAEVSDGYARNYLFPRKLALLATPVNVKKFEEKLKERAGEIAAKKQAAEELAAKLEAKELVIKTEAGEEGKIFGTVTSQNLVELIKKDFGIELDKRKININQHIALLGDYTATAKLHHEVNALIKFRVDRA